MVQHVSIVKILLQYLRKTACISFENIKGLGIYQKFIFWRCQNMLMLSFNLHNETHNHVVVCLLKKIRFISGFSQKISSRKHANINVQLMNIKIAGWRHPWCLRLLGFLSSRILQNNYFGFYSAEICRYKVLFFAKAATNPFRIGVHFSEFSKNHCVKVINNQGQKLAM